MRDPIDDALEAFGLHRRVVVIAPTSTAALQFISQSDVVVSVPANMCKPVVRAFDLRTLSIPLDLPSVPVIQAWHQRYDNDKAHSWLRSHVHKMVRAVYLPGSEAVNVALSPHFFRFG